MWARKETRPCLQEETGVIGVEEYVEIENDWKEVFFEGAFGLWSAFFLFWMCFFFTPFMMIRAVYMQYMHVNVPVPPNEVRERAHFF